MKKQSTQKIYESRFKPMSAKAYKEMLKQSEEYYKSGRIITQQELEKELEIG